MSHRLKGRLYKDYRGGYYEGSIAADTRSSPSWAGIRGPNSLDHHCVSEANAPEDKKGRAFKSRGYAVVLNIK